jgi:hypothetical protein
MPSLKEFVAALQAGWLLTTAVLVGVFSFSILLANIAYAPIVIWEKLKKRRARKTFKESIQQEILTAPPEEIEILAYLVTTGRRAFSAGFNDKRVSPLVSKGMIVKLGGAHSMLEWPYIVHKDVWQLLLENKE